jgi:hypothetical protein
VIAEESCGSAEQATDERYTAQKVRANKLADPHLANVLGYLTPAEFAQRSAAPSGCARMAPPDGAASSAGESVFAGVVLENPKPEKVSLAMD